MARLSRDEAKERTREKLLASAHRAFAREGYAAASVDQIAEGAGFSKGAFYSNFSSKEALFLGLLERHLAREVEVARDAVSDGAFAPALERFIDHYALDREDQEWCLLSVEFALQAARDDAFAPRYAALYEAHYRDIAAVLQQLAEVGGGRVGDCGAAAAKFVAFRRGLALDRGSAQPHLSQNDVRATLGAFVRGLLELPFKG